MSVINYEVIFEQHPLPMWVLDSENQQLLAINQSARSRFSNKNQYKYFYQNMLPGVSVTSFPLLHQEKQGQLIVVNEESQHKLTLRKNLQEIHQFYWRNLQNNQQIYCQCLTDKTITWANNSYCDYVQQSLSEIIGTKFPFIAKVEENTLFSQISLDNTIREYEYYNLQQNLWQSWQIEGIFDQEHNLLQYQFLGNDLTINLKKNLLYLQTIKAAELGLSTEEITSLSGTFVYQTNKNNHKNNLIFTYFSDSIADICELDKEDIINNWFLFLYLVHPQDLLKLIRSFNQAKKLVTSWHFSCRIITKSGKIKTIDLFAIPEVKSNVIVWTGFLLVINQKKEIQHKHNILCSELEKNLKANFQEFNKNQRLLKLIPSYNNRIKQESALLEERLNMTFEVAEMGTWDWNIITGEIIWSDSLFKIFGIESDNFQVNYDTFLNLIHPEDKERVLTAIKAAIEANISYKIEFRFIKPNGEKRHCLSRGKVIFDQNNIPIYMTGIDMDITNKKRIETALEISEEKFRTQYQSFPLPTYTWQRIDEHYVLLDYNMAAFNFTQGNISSLVGQTVKFIYNHIPEILADFDHCFTQQQTIKKKMNYQMLSTGENKILIVYYIYVPPDIIMVHTQDITAQEKSRLALEKSEENYRRLIETTNEGVLVVNNFKKLEFVNAKMAEMLGYQKEEMIDKNWFDFFLVSNNCGEGNCISELCIWKKEQQEVALQHKNGTIVYAILATNYLYDQQGNTIGNLAMVTNITELKLSQFELEKMNQTLENRVKHRTNQLRNTNTQLLIEGLKRQQILHKYYHLMNNLTEIVFQLDSFGNWLFINSAWTKITGFTSQETLGKNFLDFIPLPQRNICQNQLDQLLIGEKENFAYQTNLITRNNDLCWVEISATISSEDKTVIGIINNITEKQQAQQAQKESEARFRSLFEQAAVGVCLIDLDGKFILVNQRFAQLLGYDREELIGRFYHDFSPSIDVKTESDYWQELLIGTIDNYSLEKCFCKSDNFLIWTDVSMSLLKDEDHQSKYFIAIVQDISQRKETEAKLQESQARLKQAQRIANLGSWEYDLSTGLINLSEEILAIFGINQEEFQPNYLVYLDQIHPDDRDKFVKLVKETIVSKKGFCMEHRVILTNNVIKYIYAKGEIVTNFKGEVIKLIGTAQDVTYLKFIQQEIEEKRQQLLTVIETVGEGITLSDEQGNFLIFNSKMRQITGYSLAEVENSHGLIEFLYPNLSQQQEAMNRLNLVEQEGELQNIETQIINKFGEEKILLVSTTLLIDKGNKLFLSAYRDITERYNALQEKAATQVALEESEARYRRMIETAAEGIFILNEYSEITFVNEKTSEMFGLSQIEIIGKNLLDFVAFDHIDKALKYMKNLHQGKFLQQDFKFYHNNGQELWVIMNASPIFTVNNNYQGTLVMLTDITERHQNQLKLKQIRLQLQHLLSSSSAIIYSCNPENLSYNFISDNLKEIIGYNISEIKSCVDFIHPDDRITLFDIIKSDSTGDRTVHEYRFLHKNGTYRWLRDEIRITRDQDGKIKEIIGCIVDINDRKLAEQEILKALEKERELSEFKSRFISITSHEFRTPLTTILSSSQLLQRYDWSSEEQCELFEQIDNGVKYLTALIDDVHTINQGKSGVLTFNPQPIFVVDFTRRFLIEIQNGIGQNHQIIFTLNSPTRDLETNLDQKLIRQILTNLLSNAIKYSPLNSLIKFSLTINSKQLIWQIEDQGRGIPESAKTHLFTSFYRANNVGTISGTGLGLAIVKNCLELHNGEISFESILGEGTTFTVIIPSDPVS